MVELYYGNMGLHRPEITMMNVYRRLGPVHNYLVRARRAFENRQFALKWKISDDEPLDKENDGTETSSNEEQEEGDQEIGWERIILSTDGIGLKETEIDYVVDQFLKASRIWDDKRCRKKNAIDVIDADTEKNLLVVERLPEGEFIYLRADTYQINMQIKSLEALQNKPYPAHYPLMMLLENLEFVWWPEVEKERITKWFKLTDISKPGTKEQREFVERALGTPDFMILEGPPGSGKTTAITELILQAVKRGKRILLVASTHVAVDNVLERLQSETEIIAVRIGDERRVSKEVSGLRLSERRKTDRKKITEFLRNLGKDRSKAQDYLKEALESESGENVITRIILDSANLVCGTTIGILQHPDIRAARFSEPPFDIMILDEASKTTFQEFLVPALYAKKWIISGDPRQLSPYVEEEIVRSNVESLLEEEEDGEICLNLFPSLNYNRNLLVIEDDEKRINKYKEQVKGMGKNLALVTSVHEEETNLLEIFGSEAIVIQKTVMNKYIDFLPMDIEVIITDEPLPAIFQRRNDYWRHKWKKNFAYRDDDSWADGVAWRLIRIHDLRKTPEERENYVSALDLLMPKWYDKSKKDGLELIRRIALPSVIELLQEGFERKRHDRWGCVLTDGFPQKALEPRHIMLSHQHRMHSDISEFPRDHIYLDEDENPQGLLNPDYLDIKREKFWNYPRFDSRTIWIDVVGKKEENRNINLDEVNVVVKEVRDFIKWAAKNPKKDGTPWEIALLSFYKGQEKELSYTWCCNIRSEKVGIGPSSEILMSWRPISRC